jgi:hypothetical protein
MALSDPTLISHLKELYSAYRRTQDIDAKGLFFSSRCLQICRPQPSYAARNRETIVRYLHEAAAQGRSLATSSSTEGDDTVKPKKKGYYTIRPLRTDEIEFGTDEQVAPTGVATAEEMTKRAKEEGWVGMRVDLWDDEGLDSDGKAKGLLVQVQYWWRKEDESWIQCCHDIMYLGRRDGSEGADGDILE